MKVIVLHPPMYPVNHRFYNLLSKRLDLIVYQFGDRPEFHTEWTSVRIRQNGNGYKLKIFGKGPANFKKLSSHSFVKDIVREKPDIVLSIAFWLPSFYVSILKTFCSFKFIILTNMISATEKNISKRKRIFRNIIARKVDIFISASNLTNDYLLKEFPKNEVIQSIQTIDVNNWERMFSALPDKIELINRLKIPKAKSIMLGVGNFIEKKNWKSVLRAMINQENVLFILIGSGSQESEYEEIIKRNKLGNKVYILGKKEGKKLLEYFKISDFLIFPSHYDQFGFVVQEALTSGLPVICSKNTGASNLITEGENGYIIDPEKDLTDSIKKMTLNIKYLRLKAHLSISSKNLENRANEFETIFRKVTFQSKNKLP